MMKEWKIKNRLILLLVAALVLALAPGAALSAGKADKPVKSDKSAKSDKSDKPMGILSDQGAKSNSPIHIASDRLEADQNNHTILFEGHVAAQQDDLTITGSRMKVFAAPANDKADQAADKSSMMNKIDRIEVEGGVKIVQRDKVATSDKAVYYHQEQKIVLLGNPSVTQGQDKVQGRLITLLVAQGKSIVEGGEKTPVQVLLHPKQGKTVIEGGEPTPVQAELPPQKE